MRSLFERMAGRLLPLFLAAAVLLPAVLGFAAAEGAAFMPGDVNGNNKIDPADYAMCKRAYLRTYTLSEEQAARADINRNGRTDASEYAMIKRHYLGTYFIPGAEDVNGKQAEVENGLFVKMPADRPLRIAQFADLHIGTEGSPYQNDKVERTKNYLKYIAEEHKPDLIVCSGDNIMTTGVNALKEFAEFMDGLKTPWTLIYGNHDAESTAAGYCKKDLSDYLESCGSPYLLYESGYIDKANNRYGNFSISVLSPGGTRLLGAILLLDAGVYSSSLSSYEAITEGQIEWYSSEIDRLNGKYSGAVIPSVVFSHIQLPEFHTAYLAARNGSGAEFVIDQELSASDVSCIKTGGPTYKNTGLFDVMVEKGSTRAYFVGHEHTFGFQVKMSGITMGFAPQSGFSTLFENNDLKRTTYIYNLKTDFSFTTDVAVEPGEGIGLTYCGSYDGEGVLDESTGCYTAELELSSGNSIMLGYGGERLRLADISVSGDCASSASAANGEKLYTKGAVSLVYGGGTPRRFTLVYDPAKKLLSVAAEKIDSDPDAPTSLTAKTVNVDAGADAIAVWTESGKKIRELTDLSTGAAKWVGNSWRYYIIVDGEGRIAYAVQWPDSGYGGPMSTGYYCNNYYSDYTQNPAIVLYEGYKNDWASGGIGYKLFEIVVPEGGFAITSHGSTNSELIYMLSQGKVNNHDISNINKRNVYGDEIRLSYDPDTKTVSLYTVQV